MSIPQFPTSFSASQILNIYFFAFRFSFRALTVSWPLLFCTCVEINEPVRPRAHTQSIMREFSYEEDGPFRAKNAHERARTDIHTVYSNTCDEERGKENAAFSKTKKPEFITIHVPLFLFTRGGGTFFSQEP